MDGGMAAQLRWATAAVMGNGGGDATAGVTIGDSDSVRTIPMAVNGGGAMDGPNGWQDGSDSAMAIP